VVVDTQVRQHGRVVETVVRRASEALGTRVQFVDGDHHVISGGTSGAVGANRNNGASRQTPLRIPVTIGPISGDMVIHASPGDGPVTPRVAQALVELLIQQVEAQSRAPSQQEIKNQFILSLLRGTAVDEGDMQRKGHLLGMDLTLPRAVILIDAADYILAPDHQHGSEAFEAQILRRAQVVIRSVVTFFSLPTDSICAYIGHGEIAVLKASSTRDLVAWTEQTEKPSGSGASWADLAALKRASTGLLLRVRQDTAAAASIGLGRYHPGVRGLARSYRDALAALSIGTRLQGPNLVHCLDGLGVAAFVGVSDQRTKIDLATHLLSPLDQEPELLETLDAFFLENCCLTSTAGRISVHRNTLAYRFDKISALTGLDPRHFSDAVQMLLALLLRSFRDSPSVLQPA